MTARHQDGGKVKKPFDPRSGIKRGMAIAMSHAQRQPEAFAAGGAVKDLSARAHSRFAAHCKGKRA